MNNQPENQPCQDSIVETNVELLRQRSRVGESKYGVTLSESKLSDPQIIQHAIEEALDLANYLQLLASQVPTPQPQSTEHETLIETLYAWSLQHKIFPAPLPGIYHFRKPKSTPLFEIEISVRGTVWGFSVYQGGKLQQSGGVGTPADLIELLNRLLTTK